MSARYPGYDDSSDGDLNARAFQQLVSEVDAIPEGDYVALDSNVVLAVQPVTDGLE